MSLTVYGNLCTEFYNITKPIGGHYPDVPYYIRHLSKIGGRILEAMVGTGRLLIPLLEAGLNVEGIDNSPHMLAVCQQNCAERGSNPVLYSGSIETLDVPGKFDAIVVTWGSFMLLEKRSGAIAALQAFTKHLEPGGQIFIDLEIPVESFKTENIVKQREVQCPDGSIIVMQFSSRMDWLLQVQQTWNRYEKWKDGQLIDTELQSFPLHWFGREEFMMCLREQGYTDVTLCADYIDGREPSSHLEQLCFSATFR
uniref:Methyltransferase domain-containing protein n=1 Tax=Tolypothrix bouteillei VB521301 TaxID=1479485 RepID=A0A0C1NFN2_9CYAN